MTQNPWHKDYYFLKFCRARKFDLPKVKDMFTNYMKYRTENDLDNIISVSIIPKLNLYRVTHSNTRKS
jgi:hypothetical protein